MEKSQIKIIVLDDDPTGVQTVHGIDVYTDWSEESIRQGFEDPKQMFFILTNSRGFTESRTQRVHQEIGERIVKMSEATGQEFVLISRGDSTLRGHYPLETQTLRDTFENLGRQIDGEILCPFFPEGGRYTISDTHYVVDGTRLVPAGETEFAKDRTYGYRNSDLKLWIEEKSKGRWKGDQVVSVTLEELRSANSESIEKKLMGLMGFQKLIVNAITYEDLKFFVSSCLRCIQQGKHYIFRTAASFTKVMAGIEDEGLLERSQLRDLNNPHGGVIMIGSHVQKTTRQLEVLMQERRLKFIEFHVALVSENTKFREEQERVIDKMKACVAQGRTCVIYTSRERIDQETGDREDDLRVSMKISEAVTGIISALDIRPSFVVAKGGITSSEIGTIGLKVKKALVLGQILPGIPVWKTGAESRFPNLAYVIFPGNVGSETALYEVAKKII